MLLSSLIPPFFALVPEMEKTTGTTINNKTDRHARKKMNE